MTVHKGEALKALAHLQKRLDDPADPLDGLARRHLRATVEFAIEQVEAIQEVKRVRKAAQS